MIILDGSVLLTMTGTVEPAVRRSTIVSGTRACCTSDSVPPSVVVTSRSSFTCVEPPTDEPDTNVTVLTTALPCTPVMRSSASSLAAMSTGVSGGASSAWMSRHAHHAAASESTPMTSQMAPVSASPPLATGRIVAPPKKPSAPITKNAPNRNGYQNHQPARFARGLAPRVPSGALAGRLFFP